MQNRFKTADKQPISNRIGGALPGKKSARSALLLCLALQLFLSSSAQSGKKTLVDLADELSIRHKYRPAISLCDQVLSKNPVDARALTVRGSAKVTLGDLAGGLKDLKLATKLNPTEPKNYIYLGQAYVESHDLNSAEITYDKAVKLAPNQYRTLRQYSETCLQNNHPEKARVGFDRLVKIDSGNDDSWIGRANYFFSQGQYKKAVEDYTVAIKLTKSRKGRFYAMRARAYQKMGDKAAADKDLKLADEFGMDLFEQAYDTKKD